MQYKALAALVFAATALATPAPEVTGTAVSVGTETNPEGDAAAASKAAALLAGIPTSIVIVMETAIPASWQQAMLTDPAFRSSVASAAAMGSYPAWYNALPGSVKAWVTSFDAQILGVPAATAVDSASKTGFRPSETGSSNRGASDSASQTASSAVQTPSGSSSSSSSHSAPASASSSKSKGGAPGPTGVAMAVGGGAGMLALALAL